MTSAVEFASRTGTGTRRPRPAGSRWPRHRPGPGRRCWPLRDRGAAAQERRRYDQARAAWHANLGPIRTPQVDAIFEALEEICGSNLQDGDKVRPAAVLDALPGLGKTTAALAFGRWFHREQVEMHGPRVQAGDGTWQRIPVAYLGLTSHTTMRSLNAMLCRFYGLPETRQRRPAGPSRRRVRRELQDPAGHRGRRALPGHFPPRRTRGRQPLQVAGQRLPGHFLVRRRRAARPRPAG